MLAHESAEILQRVCIRQQLPRTAVIALGDLLHHGLHRHMMRADALARRGEIRLLDVGITGVERHIRGGLYLGDDKPAHLGKIGVAMLLHIIVQTRDHGPDDVIAGDQRLGAHAQKRTAAQHHLHGVAPVGDAARGHDGRLEAADLTNFIGIALRQRLEPAAAIAAHGQLVLQMEGRRAGIVQVDGRHAQPVAGTADGVRARFIERLRHMGDLAALGRQLDKQRNVDFLLDRADDLRCDLRVLAHARAGLLGRVLAAAGGHLQVVAHVRAAHIQLDDVRTGLFKLLGHVHPARGAVVPGIGDVCHELEVVQQGLCLADEL